MSGESINEILKELSKPFHPSHITWKPGVLNRERNRALALAYADLRAYQNRLDEICGLDWSVSYTPWGDRIVCHLTINGITRSSTGEPDSQSERSEIAGTAAEAQAFKRACAMFGLGRYLYNLPAIWVEYDEGAKQFSERAWARLNGIVVHHYRRNADPEAEMAELLSDVPEEENHTNGAGSPDLESLRGEFDRLGRQLYGEQWEQVCRHNVRRISGGEIESSGQLNREQIEKLIKGMRKLMRNQERDRHPQAA